MRVRVKQSPYRSVKVGARGTVIQKKYVETIYEAWRVKVDNTGESRLFHKEELEVIDG